MNNRNKIVVIHHSADSDGLMSAAVCRYALSRFDGREAVTSIGWDYGQPVPEVPECDLIYMVDVSVDAWLEQDEVRRKTVLIDHHRTCAQKWGARAHEFRGWVLHEGIAACRLCWMNFFGPWVGHDIMLKMQEGWKTGPVAGEPLIVFLIGLRDVWAHRGTEWEATAVHLELGLRANWPPDMDKILAEADLDELVAHGALVQGYADAMAAEAAERGARVVEWEGLRWLSLNTQARGSLALDAHSKKLTAAGVVHDALMVWALGKDGQVNLSLYHAAHAQERDLSVIAKKHGGGGHPGACGLRLGLEQVVGMFGSS